MPKKLKTYHTFHKGLYNVLSEKLVPVEALVDCLGFNTSKPGEITLLGDGKTVYSNPGVTATVVEGYGLFLFNSDLSVLSGADTLQSAPTPTVNKTILLIQNGRYTYIWDGTYLEDSGLIDLEDETGDVKPIYINFDGSIIICDGNFVNTSSVRKQLIYIKKTQIGQSYDKWYVKDADLAPPTRFLAGVNIHSTDTGAGTLNSIKDTGGNFLEFYAEINDSITNNEDYKVVNINDNQVETITACDVAGAFLDTTDLTAATWANDLFIIHTAVGLGVCLDVAETSGAGTFNAIDEGVLYLSFVYENNQESLLLPANGTALAGSLVISANKGIDVILAMHAPYDPRISGLRIYFKDLTKGNDYSDDIHFLLEYMFDKGIRGNLSAEYDSFLNVGPGGAPYYYTNYVIPFTILDPSFDTYFSINGYNGDIDSIAAKYKTGVVVNRKLYAGNVYSNGIWYGDRMIESPVNKPNILPSTAFVDVAINDGESIIHLEALGDRILQYKQFSMYVINVAQSVAFLEASYKGVGVNKSCQVVKTEFGVISLNKNGVWIFTGEGQPKDLTEGRISLDLIEWTKTPSIGYDFIRKVLVIYCSTASDGTGDFYEYNFKFNQWTSGEGGVTLPATNFVNDLDSELIYFSDNGATDQVYKHTETAVDATTNNIFTTKDEFFEDPNVKKDIHKIRYHINSGASTTLDISYMVDNNGTWVPVESAKDVSTTGANEFQVFESDSINAFGVYSIKFKFEVSTASNFSFKFGSFSIFYSLKEPI